MKKLALLLIVSVLTPSLVLAWLAVRSLRDQEYVLQRQQSVIYQALADNLAHEVQAQLENAAHDFNLQVLGLLTNTDVRASPPALISSCALAGQWLKSDLW